MRPPWSRHSAKTQTMPVVEKYDRAAPRRPKGVCFAAAVLIAAGLWGSIPDGRSDDVIAPKIIAGTAPVSSGPGFAGRRGARASDVLPPGRRPGMNRWMMARDQPLIRLNNALVPVVRGTFRRGGAHSAECRRLDASARALRSVGRAPDARVDAFATAGLDEIEQAVSACLGSDLVRMRQLVMAGLDKRAAASLKLDEVLEGE